MRGAMNHRMKERALILCLVVAAAVLAGCADDQFVGPGRPNQPPRVWLSSAPPEGSVTQYSIHLYWGGWDPDGEIAYYQYAITDNDRGAFDPADTTGADKWRRVYANDSTFIFTADQLADSSEAESERLTSVEFVRTHTFFIRAVDREGLASDRPAYRSFTARTLSPTVDIILPRRVGIEPAQVPPISTFKWIGQDYVTNTRQAQEPDSVRWIIVGISEHGGSWVNTIDYIRRNPDAPEWSDWHYYRAPRDSGKSWTSRPLDLGSYVFAVQVKDEAGAVSPVFDEARNMRRVSISRRLTGPVLRVTNRYVGSLITTSPNAPLTIVDLPSGIPMSFQFTANAAIYGGVASAYRYGWDITDPKVDSQWSIDWTPFVREVDGIPTAEAPARKWFSDSHTFLVEVIDNSGYTSRAGVQINVVPFSMRKNLIVIDDCREAGNASLNANGYPSDDEHDAFWADMLSDVKGFDPTVDIMEVGEDLPIQAVADYKSMIWNTFSAYNLGPGVSLLPEIIRFVPDDPSAAQQSSGKVKLNILALYMAAGGHVLLCGDQPMTAAVTSEVFAGGNRPPAFPLIFRYELLGDQKSPYDDSDVGVKGVGENSFAYNECCLNVLDISVITTPVQRRRPANATCPVHLLREYSGRTEGLRFAIPLSDEESFPMLELRPEVTASGKPFEESRSGLVNDVYNPPYFQNVCPGVAETSPPRACFQPIYGHGCLNEASRIYGAPVAFWTGTFADRVPDSGTSVAARSVVWGFDPVFFKPDQVKRALASILFDEWQLPRDDE